MLIYVLDLFDGGAEAPKAPPWIRHCSEAETVYISGAHCDEFIFGY